MDLRSRIAHRCAALLLRHRRPRLHSASKATKVSKATLPPPPISQRKWDTSSVEDCAPLSGGRPWASTAVTVTVKFPSAVDSLEVTVNVDVAEPAVTVAEGGFAQDGTGCVTPVTAHVKSTLPVKPLKGMTVMVEIAAPALIPLGVSGDKAML